MSPVSDASSPRLQPLTRARVRTLGAVGHEWQERLPTLLAELADRWRLTYGRGLPGGSNSYVIRAIRADREPVVLKVSMPSEDQGQELLTLRRAGGRGYVRLLDGDVDRRALLLEQLGSSLQSQPGQVEDQLRIMSDTLSLAWQRPVDFPELDPRPGKAAGLVELITTRWDRLGHPCPARVIDQALADAEWLAARPVDEPVVVHGDPHPQNLLRVPVARPGAESGYCFVDPEGFVEDPGYDLGVAIRDFSARLLTDRQPRATLERYAETLAEHSGVDAERIWRWAFLERVSSGLYVLSFGAERVARPFLDSAQALLS